MSSTKEANLSNLFAELNKLGQNGEYERALKTANKILQISAEDEKAFHCKIVCLIQLSKFHDALQFINKNPKLSGNLLFEKAYAQYRQNNPQEALKTVNLEQQPSLKLKELKAQILYRLEKYEECFDVYRDIIKNTEDDYEDERETNLSAVIASLSMEGSDKDLPSLRESTYELVYNAATQLIGRGQFIEAEKKLRQAEKMCREMLEEDGSPEEDIEEELGIIKVQLAYCLQIQGREKEAQGIYSATLKRKPDDISLVAIASNNGVVVNKDQNVFDSKKKMKSALVDGLEHKLTSRQRKNIALNNCLLLLYSKGEQCQKQCEQVARTHPELGAELALIQATQMARDGRARAAAGVLEKAASSNPKLKLDMQLASVQLLLSEGDRKESCSILRNLGESTFKPGVVSALVTLYLAENNREAASNILKEAVDWYKKSKDKGDLRLLWRQAADLHMRSGDPKTAAQSLEELLRLNPDSKKTLAQLVIAYAQFDPAKATALSKKLPNLDCQGQDVDMLESSNWIMGTKVIKKASKVEPSPGSKSGTPGDDLLQKKLAKKKKKRKGKLPKPYESGALPEPNPDRWLPRHERPGYKKKRDRRNKDAGIGKGTQGAATGASDVYDMSKAQNLSKASPAVTTSPAMEPGPRQQARKVQQKKKKGKGRY